MKTPQTLLFALFLGVCFASHCEATIYNSDGSAASVQALHNAALDGDTIALPAGTFTWSTGVIITKGIKIQGAGSGRIIGRSLSSAAVGTGSQTFVTQSGLNISAGQILTVESMPLTNGTVDGRGTYMRGTVTSYSGTSLVMNVTATGGSGTHDFWKIETQASTTINHGSDSNVPIAITESTAGSVEITGIRFTQFVDSSNIRTISVTNAASGKPVLIHDCWFSQPAGSNNAIDFFTNRGVVWNCSFDASPFGISGTVGLKWAAGTTSWTTLSTMGAADTTGINNLYVEDCDFHAYLNAGGVDDNGRMVLRHMLFDNAGFGTHGADTSDYGQRHFEVYDSEFVFNSTTGDVLNLNWWFFIRGGTFIVADCIMPLLSSQDYGNKPSFNLTVMNLGRNAGPNPCWGAGIPGNQYPAPRQTGMGRITGLAGFDSITYVGDTEPIYIWNITGPALNMQISDYQSSECGTPDQSANYIQQGRDYFIGIPKPGYTKFIYPHPLRGEPTPPSPAPTPTPSATATATATPVQSPSPSATVTVTPTITPSPTPTPRPTPTPTPPPNQCEVPNFMGTRLNRAQSMWNAAGFILPSTIAMNGSNGRPIIWQSLPAGSFGVCANTGVAVQSR